MDKTIKKTKKGREKDFPPGFPVDELSVRLVKLYILGTLAWDYVGTVLDIVSQARQQELKKLTRIIRMMKAEYDSNQRAKLPLTLLKRQADMSMQFEGLCERHLDKFYEGIGFEQCVSDLTPNEKIKVKAVVAASTVLNALMQYAKECDRWLVAHGMSNYSVLDPSFGKLTILIPEFAGDSYPRSSKWISHTSTALLNELKFIELYGGSRENEG